MTLYSVYERKEDVPAVVADRFSWSAAVLPPVHALVHGLWLMLVVWAAGLVALGFAGVWLGFDVAAACYLLFALLLGFEAAGFRRAALRRRGWGFASDVAAAAPDLALREYLRH